MIQELRIGNWLLDGFGKYYQVEVADLVLLASRPDTKECNPIPLTPELLEKAGFDKGNYHTNWFSHVKLNCHLVQFDDGEYVLEVVDDIRISEPFKYVHQLQNLYFALCGEELTINL